MRLFDEIHSSCEADVYQPLLEYLRAKKMGKNTPPYIPKWGLMSVLKLTKLALLWHEAGFSKEATHLSNWLLKLEPFLPLWCSDKEYDEKEGKRLFSLLHKLKSAPGEEPEFNLAILSTPKISAALTLDGNGTSLGVIRAGEFEIRAFGPQDNSLNFGIKGRSIDGWTRVAAFPEVWLEMNHRFKDDECKFDFRFIGLKPENPLYLAFYVKAQSCQIGNEVFKPKSLKRFHGEAQSVNFENQFRIESGQPHKVQLIPLAGENCFWNCEFMLAFELHPFVTQVTFKFFL